uniref:Uncharacterized protein n=1 Tax=Plectus sambesii TaxID=2011161 RepID=A0A914X3K5_9BILA
MNRMAVLFFVALLCSVFFAAESGPAPKAPAPKKCEDRKGGYEQCVLNGPNERCVYCGELAKNGVVPCVEGHLCPLSG